MRGKKAKALRNEAAQDTIGLDELHTRRWYQGSKAAAKSKPPISKFPEARRRKSTQVGLLKFLARRVNPDGFGRHEWHWAAAGAILLGKDIGHPMELHPSYDQQVMAQFT